MKNQFVTRFHTVIGEVLGVRRGLAWSFAVVLGASGVGCSAERPRGSSEPTISEDPFSCSADDGLALDPISDFESGMARGFYVNNDASVGSTSNPPRGASSPLSEAIEGGRCGTSAQAFHLTGNGFTDWGMVWGLNFNGAPLDESEWEGVSFWAKRGTGSEKSLFFSVTDMNTDPVGGMCLSESPDLEKKCDAYGVGVGLEEDWRFFRIPFSSLRQRGFGVVTKEFLREKVVGIGWAAGPGTWDVWVDDVAFYRADTGVGGASGS